VQSERVVRPWAEVKSRRGRRKRAKTEGYACPNEKCEYYGITDVYCSVTSSLGPVREHRVPPPSQVINRTYTRALCKYCRHSDTACWRIKER
jgi:hypothetical protein